MPIQRKPRRLALPAPQILIVDDDPSVGRALTRWFRSKFEPYPTVHARNLTEARTAMASAPTCAVLLDIGLGEENGLDLVHELRAANDPTPVLVVTADTALSRVRDATRAGACIAFKPFEEEDLVSFVRDSLAHPRTRDVVIMLMAMEAELTTREAETLFAMLEHDGQEETAAFMGIALSTAKTNMGHVYRKLHSTSCSEILRRVIARQFASVSYGQRRVG